MLDISAGLVASISPAITKTARTLAWTGPRRPAGPLNFVLPQLARSGPGLESAISITNIIGQKQPNSRHNITALIYRYIRFY
jgi:hypothetical protein